MSDRDAFIGQPEVLLGIMPGGGGSQRRTRLVGVHRSLVAILDGKLQGGYEEALRAGRTKG